MTTPPVTTPPVTTPPVTTPPVTTPPVTTPPVTTPPTPVPGTVYSGQNRPVAGATIALYAVGNAGYGAGAQSLVTGSVTSDSNGHFDLGGAYQCSSSTAKVYLVATGGVMQGAGANSAIALMSALGDSRNHRLFDHRAE